MKCFSSIVRRIGLLLSLLVVPLVYAAPGDIQFSDNFERATLAPNWTSSNPAVTGIGTQTANSPTRSGFTSNTAVQLTSIVIPLNIPGAEVSVWIRRGADAFSEDTDAGENLLLEYRRNDGSFATLATFFGAGTNGEILETTFALPNDALHSGFQLRFSQTGGSGTGFDFWHIDDALVREIPPVTGGGGIGVGECETFEGGLGAFDIQSSGGSAGVSTATSQSPLLSAFTNGGVVSLISRPTNTLFGFTGVSYFVQRGSDAFSEDPDAGEDLQVSYINNTGDSIVVDTFAGAGTPGQSFVRTIDLSTATDAQHENFQLQFTQLDGDPATFDFWHIDDVCLLGALVADIAISSTVVTETDPINATTNPKAIPQSELIYQVETTNQGPSVDMDTVSVRIDIPDDTELFVGDFDGSGSPLRFVDGAVPSGLSVSFGGLADAVDGVEFLDAGDNPIVPNGTAQFDPLVRAVQVTLNGLFASATQTATPSFVLAYRVRLN